MPFVTVHCLAGRTETQKAVAADHISKALETAFGTAPEATQVVFIDVPASSWAHGPVLVSQRDNASAAPEKPKAG